MTTRPDPTSYRNFWEEAERAELGLFVRMKTEEDKRLLINNLYECRKIIGGFGELMIFQPGTTVFYIAKRTLKELP